MTTVINTPNSGSDNSGVGMLVGIVLAVVLLGAFVLYAFPELRNGLSGQPNPSNDIQVDVKLPAPAPAPTPTPAPAPTPTE